MRLTLACFSAACVAAVIFVFGAAPASGVVRGCPDGMTPAPVIFVNNGEQKDKNMNGVICAKPAPQCVVDGTCPGGPDEALFGPPLQGLNGHWYFVTDDVPSA